MSGPTPNGLLLKPSWGGPLTEADHAKLERSWIARELADQALLRRVTSPEGASIVGRHDNGSYEGIIFPYVFWPGEDHIREYWLRRDRPDIERTSEGQPKEKNKYLGPPGRGNLVYFMPGTRAELLDDRRVPIAITEGAKKTIALYQLAHHGVDPGLELPRFLPIGLAGVWSFRGKTGKMGDENGSPREEKGWIPDLARLRWEGRRVYIVYDSNVKTNDQVAAARRALTRDLAARNAQVLWVNVPSTVARVA
jgi:hypothetical protein